VMNFWRGRAKDSRVHLASDEQLVLNFVGDAVGILVMVYGF